MRRQPRPDGTIALIAPAFETRIHDGVRYICAAFRRIYPRRCYITGGIRDGTSVFSGVRRSGSIPLRMDIRDMAQSVQQLFLILGPLIELGNALHS